MTATRDIVMKPAWPIWIAALLAAGSAVACGSSSSSSPATVGAGGADSGAGTGGGAGASAGHSTGGSGGSGAGGADAGSFATPDLLNNASFETGWDGFQNNSGGSPSPASGSFSISRSQDHARDGTWSAKSTYAANGTDNAVAFTYEFGTQEHFFARVWFYRTGNLPTNHHKWIRFKNAAFDPPTDGLYLSTSGMSWVWMNSNPGSLDLYLKVNGKALIPTANAWHSIEVEYDFTNSRARFWYDGALVTAFDVQNATNITVDPVNGWLTCSTPPSGNRSRIVFDDTYNGGNTASGAFYYDRIAISTKRIGPE